MEHTPKNILLRAVKKGSLAAKSRKEAEDCERFLKIQPTLGMLLAEQREINNEKRVIKIAALVVLFAAVLVISNVILNRGNDDQVVDMGDATLPRVSFMMGGQKINALPGYVDDMDIAAMRDTITPLESDGTLKMQIEKNDNQIREISYSVYSLDGTETYDKGTLKSAESEDVTLKSGNHLDIKSRRQYFRFRL